MAPTDDRGNGRPVSVPADQDEVSGEQLSCLLGHRCEHRGRRLSLRDECRYPPQRGLFIGDPAEVGVHLRVVQRDRELVRDQRDRGRAFGGERTPEEMVLEQQHRVQPVPTDDRYGRHRAAAEVGEVRVAGEAVVVSGVGDDQRLTGALGVAQHGHRHRVLVAGAADRDGGTAGDGEQPVALVVAPQQQVHVRGTGQRAEHLGDAGV